MDENEERLWQRIAYARDDRGVPRAICSALAPFPFWAVIASIIIFIPIALIVSFFVKRYAILVQAGEIVVLELSFWRYRVLEEISATELGSTAVGREGNRLTVGAQLFHLEPGWGEAADRLIDFNAG